MSNLQNFRKILLPLIVAFSILLGFFVNQYFFQHSNTVVTGNFKPSKIDNLLQKIAIDYVDPINYDSIQEIAIPKIIKNLDPHSGYIPASMKEEVDAPLYGAFDGVGIQFVMKKDTVVVIKPISGGPSEKIGIISGDRIVTVDDSIIAGVKLSQDSVMKKLKGPRGSKVKVGVRRSGVEELIEFEIIRDKIPIYSVDVAYFVTPKTGYVKVSKFSRNTYAEFMKAANKFKAQKAKNIIVDLRGNGGGVMESAIRMADEFIEPNKLIVYTKGNNRAKREYRASQNFFLGNMNVAVLIDEWSASASEIFTGALQDNDKGYIIGRRSFGKGLVQEPMYFRDGSELRLTVARYYTPTGRSIQKPYKKGDEGSYRDDIANRYLNGEFLQKDSIQFSDSLKYISPGGKILYGGGGIMPDLFVPVDTTGGSKLLYEIRRKGLVYSFAYDYTDKNRQALSQFKFYENLENYLYKQNVIDEFLEYVKKKEVKVVASDVNLSGKILKVQLIGLIVRNVIGDEGFYPIINKIDTTLNIAIDVLENKESSLSN